MILEDGGGHGIICIDQPIPPCCLPPCAVGILYLTEVDIEQQTEGERGGT